jgi:hypothetical protein
MSAGAGLIVLAVIFAVGVVLFGLLMIVLLPAATAVEERIEALRSRRAAPPH